MLNLRILKVDHASPSEYFYLKFGIWVQISIMYVPLRNLLNRIRQNEMAGVQKFGLENHSRILLPFSVPGQNLRTTYRKNMTMVPLDSDGVKCAPFSLCPNAWVLPVFRKFRKTGNAHMCRGEPDGLLQEMKPMLSLALKTNKICSERKFSYFEYFGTFSYV